MDDLISRQAAIDAMAELQGRASSKGELTGISKAWKRIKQLPPIQPKRGKWIDKGVYTVADDHRHLYECDRCGGGWLDTPKYCPNCGARMGVME